MNESDQQNQSQDDSDDLMHKAGKELSNSEASTVEKRNPAKAVSAAVAALLALLVLGYALMDRMAPSSSRGIVSANVVQIAPRVSGQVTDVWVADNAVVGSGEPLFSIERRPFELAVRQAEANLKTALQNVSASGASLVAAQASVTQARVALDNARTEADRLLRLEQRGVISASDADQARTGWPTQRLNCRVRKPICAALARS
ncbi:biotin/lipoyl-binding protein [Marinobacter sp. S6332]|uniref:HlyD family secretion protein n=1 Tax=Marinobacter sp. S6332 TaxID=2926403 RepID=UPI001FF2EA76|nr:biotin/lipoyl-binding protein [Marinobacter sp. S6332]MCK0163254.1 biotin/lipoyl-binding protein [Marinobacter sp. S6332]